MEPYRILLADDHVIFREMIKKNLEEIPGLEIVGEASNGLELLESVGKMHPQMVILDIGMPYMGGLEAAKEIKRCHPEIKILWLTMYKSKDYLSRASEVGIDGYILKDNAFKDLVAAIEEIRAGKPYISSFIIQPLLESFLNKPRPATAENEPLSSREIEVLQYFAAGKSNKTIAASLFISEATVRIHLKNIKMKLNIKDKIDLVRYAIKHGYATLT